MVIEISAQEYKRHFNLNPHPFISEQFIELNSWKVEEVVRLVNDNEKFSIGLVGGIKDGILLAPFSAPFGGFHYRSENIYISEIDYFLNGLKEYISTKSLKSVFISLPPLIYQKSFNAKVVNAFMRLSYDILLPEITCWVYLPEFENSFSYKMSRQNFNTSLRNKLTFNILTTEKGKEMAYNLILENRALFGRPIFMTLDDIYDINKLLPIDFFGVNNSEGQMVASAIFYQFTKDIVYGVFWGDNIKGRSVKSMDFLSFNLWSHYKSMGYKYIDLSKSTENGLPNESLLWFKEVHECTSSLRFSFMYNVTK